MSRGSYCHSHGVSCRIKRRGQIDITGARCARARPLEAPLVRRRLQTRERAVHDVDLSIERDVRIAVDREHSASRIERAIGVCSRCDSLETQTVRRTVTRAGSSSRDNDLSTLRALLRDGELIVDWNRRAYGSR